MSIRPEWLNDAMDNEDDELNEIRCECDARIRLPSDNRTHKCRECGRIYTFEHHDDGTWTATTKL